MASNYKRECNTSDLPFLLKACEHLIHNLFLRVKETVMYCDFLIVFFSEIFSNMQ